MIRQAMLLAIPALLLSVAGARADVYDFSYSGAGGVFGSGTFTTGTPYGDGWVPVTSITGTTEAGAILRLEESSGPGIDPDSPNAPLECCAVGPNGGDFFYDNAFMPGSPNPFSSPGGLLFDVANATDTPIELFGDGAGNTYEFSYGEDVGTLSPPAYGGTQVHFTAIPTPEPSSYGTVALCMSGLLFARWRRRCN
jgi:hypothetical protein